MANNSSGLLTEGDVTLGLKILHGTTPGGVGGNGDEEDEVVTTYIRHGWEWTLLFIVAYTVVFIVGIVGNSCVVLVILRTRSMRTVTNLFILNLAVADLLVITFCIPPTLLSNIIIRKFINHFKIVCT